MLEYLFLNLNFHFIDLQKFNFPSAWHPRGKFK